MRDVYLLSIGFAIFADTIVRSASARKQDG